LQVDRIADQGEMRKCLGKIAQKGAAFGIDFLSVQPNVVGMVTQPVEQDPRFICTTGG
jgi:hypothetical protein